jgi:hypothetical protein
MREVRRYHRVKPAPKEAPTKFTLEWVKDGYKRYKGVRGLLIALVLVSVVAFFSGALGAFSDKGKETANSVLNSHSQASPVAVALTGMNRQCPYDVYLFSGITKLRGPPAPPEYNPENTTPLDAWMRAHSGVPLTRNFEFAVQTASTEAIVLTGLRVVIDHREPATLGVQVGLAGCGGGMEPRAFDVDLGAPSPTITSIPETTANGAGGLPAVGFPYKISADDPEVFQVTVVKAAGDITWHMDLGWIANGQPGSTKIAESNGFRTTTAPMRCSLSAQDLATTGGEDCTNDFGLDK